MRPSSSSSPDPNAPYRAAIASLVDCNFFADEPTEQLQTSHPTSHQDSFSELRPRGTTQSLVPGASAEIGTSTASPITVSTIQQYLLDKRLVNYFLTESTILNRLNSVNLRAETLLAALKIVNDASHPLLARLGVRDQERTELIYRLAGITANTAGFFIAIRMAAQNANNNPYQLVAAILQHIRNLNP